LIVSLHKPQTNKCNRASAITGEQTQAVFKEVKTDMTQTTLAHISSKNIYYVTSTYSAYVA